MSRRMILKVENVFKEETLHQVHKAIDNAPTMKGGEYHAIHN